MGVKKIFCIHGFGGGPQDWNGIKARLSENISVDTIDLADFSREPTLQWEELCRSLAQKLAEQEEPFFLCGYSMGGRVALGVTALLEKIDHPPRGLILLSTGFGEEPENAAERRKKDALRAKLLREDPDRFWSEWYQQPLFHTFQALTQEKQDAWLASRRRWEPKTLANHLEFWGQTNQPWSLPILSKEIHVPVLYMTGEKDKKYCALSERVRECPHVTVRAVPGAGHLLPLESPGVCAQEITNFLEKLR